jgi:hypothetical protein
MRKLIFILTLFAGFTLWQSCEYDWVETEPINTPDTVSFSHDIIPIFERGCNAGVCHGDGGIAPILTSAEAFSALTTGGYIDTATPENSGIYVEMADGGSMNKYTAYGEPELVLKWIQQGALNN